MNADIFWRINTEQKADDQALGEKHAPVITFSDDIAPGEPGRIRVNVGGGKHPNTNEHHIQWVELRINDMFIGRADFVRWSHRPRSSSRWSARDAIALSRHWRVATCTGCGKPRSSRPAAVSRLRYRRQVPGEGASDLAGACRRGRLRYTMPAVHDAIGRLGCAWRHRRPARCLFRC